MKIKTQSLTPTVRRTQRVTQICMLKILKDFKVTIGDYVGIEIIRIVTFVGIFCIKFSPKLWYDRILVDIFFVIFRHFGPLNAIYEKLSFILGFCDPENPYFDV